MQDRVEALMFGRWWSGSVTDIALWRGEEEHIVVYEVKFVEGKMVSTVATF